MSLIFKTGGLPINYFNFGIDTIQVNSTTEREVDKSDCLFLSVVPKKDTKNKICQYRLNPDDAWGGRVAEHSLFKLAYDFMVNKTLKLENPELVRVDYRLDSCVYDFETIRPYGRAIILLLAIVFDRDENLRDCFDPLRLKGKSVVIKTQYWEVECYNKHLQEPGSGILSRIEFRSKKLYHKENRQIEGFRMWRNRLQNLACEENFKKLESTANYYLTQKYKEEQLLSKTDAQLFLGKYYENFFSKEQRFLFLKDLGIFPNEKKLRNFLRNFDRKYPGLKPINKKGVKSLIDVFCQLGEQYFNT